MPQWLEIDFGQPRTLSRLVVITYEHDKSMETAAKWGVLAYEIQAWDKVANQWQTVVTHDCDWASKVHVHPTARSLTTAKIRLVVRRVAPLDGRARILQFEAWGPKQ